MRLQVNVEGSGQTYVENAGANYDTLREEC